MVPSLPLNARGRALQPTGPSPEGWQVESYLSSQSFQYLTRLNWSDFSTSHHTVGGELLPAGPRAAVKAVPAILEDADLPLPSHLRHVLASVRDEICDIEARIAELERELRVLADADPVVTGLLTIPGIGLLTATALVGTVGHIGAFRRARQFVSWLGLTPREHSSGQRRHLGSISKQGDRYLRCRLTHGARAVLVSAERQRSAGHPLSRLHHWAVAVRDRRGHNNATIAVANRPGRLVWAVWAKDVPYSMPQAA